MAVLDFKGYSLEYQEMTQGTYDAMGDYQPGTETWVYLCKCDAVPAGIKNLIRLPDGMMDTFSFTIGNLPIDCREFKYNDRIRLIGLRGEVYNLRVKGFARYQHQCKIWA